MTAGYKKPHTAGKSSICKLFRLQLPLFDSIYLTISRLRTRFSLVGNPYTPPHRVMSQQIVAGRISSCGMRGGSGSTCWPATILKRRDAPSEPCTIKWECCGPNQDGLALRGVLVRHLVMPGLLEDTRCILQWLATELSADTYVNLMDQYHPAHKAQTQPQFSEINRRRRRVEFEEAVQQASAAGLWRLDARPLRR